MVVPEVDVMGSIQPAPSALQALLGRARAARLLLATVVVPTLIAVLYYGLVASDVYVSETRFVVRGPERQAAAGWGMLLKGTGFARSQDDGYSVQDYMLSRDALHALDTQLNLRSSYARADVLSRFPTVDRDDSFEGMHRYYQRMVSVQFDPSSSIVTLTVRAFEPGVARDVGQRLLQLGEGLVNRMNDRGRLDLVRQSMHEMQVAQQRAMDTSQALARYRNAKGVIDPEKQSAIDMQQIAKLQDELIATKAQLVQVQSLTRDNPQVPVLRRHVQMLEGEIGHTASHMAGGSASLASKVVEYQRLAQEKEFADRQFASALASLELARNEAQHQQLYLERIAEPSLPDGAHEPRRLRAVLTVLVLGLMAWGVLSMLVAGIREHQE